MNSKTLVHRDLAHALLIGAAAGSDFGGVMGGSSYGSDFGGEFGAEFGYGGDFGDDAAPAAVSPASPAHPLHPANQPKMMALWAQHQAMAKKRGSRYALLDPNAGSDLKVEGYSFSLTANITALATAQAGIVMGPSTPSTNIKPVRLAINTPCPGFLYVNNIQVSNVSIILGGAGDAWKYNANNVGAHIRVPLLTPSTPASANVTYSGLLPTQFVAGTAFGIDVGFEGPATLAGGQAI